MSLLCPWWVRTDILSSTRNRGTADGEPLTAHRELRDHGISPGEVADLAVRSIRDGRFYVHTHPDLHLRGSHRAMHRHPRSAAVN